MTAKASPEDKEYLALAQELADLARGILRERFADRVAVEYKADGTPVTPVDREVEAVLRERIGRAFPRHGILGEEEGASNLEASHVWVLDPIDGTKAFLSGKPLFGTLIALLRDGTPFLGVTESPITLERWVGLDGLGASKNGAPIHVREPRALNEAVLCAGSPRSFRRTGHDPERLFDSVRWTNYQVDCYGYGMLAQGSVDLVLETDLQPYDYCALVPIVRNAGGTITHFSGEPVGLKNGRGEHDGSLVAAASPELARAAVATLGRCS